MKLAVVGLSMKLPDDINNLDDLYQKLVNKTDCVTQHPKDRFNLNKFYDKENNIGKMRTLRGGYLKNIYDFDNTFFNISKKEAETSDPQQRMMLEMVYEALNDAKISKKSVNGSKTGVYMGCCNTEYFSQQLENSENCNQYSITGGLLTLLSNRISYYYGLIGTSLTLDTACSSSGHALHLACQSIMNGENEQCIVGGSNLLLLPETTVGFSQGQFLSPDGKCQAFDNAANGYVRAEGCVVLIVKSLENAIKDKNYIHCVINNTNVNQDGKTQSITMPSESSQKLLLEKCYKNINLDNITYVEAHGTGTKVGDKTETSSIGTILGKKRNKPLPIGSIKTNIGHTEATSGLASLCKVIVMMKKKKLLPNIHFKNPSENIDFEDLNLDVVTECSDIKDENIIMGINNYGFGGANFHCVIENYKNNDKEYVKPAENNLHMLAINGYDLKSIDKNTHQFLNYDEDRFLEYVYNQNNIDKLEQAKIFIVKDKKDFEEQLFNQDSKDLNCIHGKFTKNKPNITFVFCGQGPQFLKMGQDFIDKFPVFKEWILKCDNVWNDITGFSFIERYGMFIKSDSIDYDTIPINEPIVAQPSITFFQIALFNLYKYFGVTPDYVIGHSAGEQASFYASGALSLEDTIKVSYYRSIYQQKTVNSGNMLVINQNIDTIDEYIKANPKLELAVVNSSKSYVLAGSSEDIDNFKTKLEKEDINAIKIRGSCAFHSSLQDDIKDSVLESTKDISFLNPKLNLVSTVTGFLFDKEDYTEDYWWKNIRETVKFNEGIEQCVDSDIFIEIAPHTVLSSVIKHAFSKKLVLNSANRKEDSGYRFLSTLSKLYFSGLNININLCGKENNRSYPIYEWNHQKFIQQPKAVVDRLFSKDGNLNKISFKKDTFSYVKDHIVANKIILPTVCYIDLINRYLLQEDHVITDLKIHTMFEVIDDIEFNIIDKDNKIYFNGVGSNTTYLSFRLKSIKTAESLQLKVQSLLDLTSLDKNQMIEILNNKNFNFGNNMFSFKKCYNKENMILTEVDSFEFLNYKIYPTIIDIGLTNVMFIQGLSNTSQYLPSEIGRIEYYCDNQPKYVYTINKSETIKNCISDSYILDKEFNVIAKLSDILSTNVSVNNTKTYNVQLDSVKYPESEIENNYEYIETTNLIEIREILLKNENKIYLIDISKHYEITGFIRVILNEYKTINYKICYYENSDKLLENIKYTDFSNIESIYKDGEFYNYKIDFVKDSKRKIDNYYLDYTHKGSINNLVFREKNIYYLENDEVLIQIESSAINFKDIAVILGIIPDKDIGYEISGTVIESKSNLFSVGDKVFGTDPINGRGITNTIICNDKYIWKNPLNMTFEEACSIGISYGTAYLSLISYANIKSSDIVLLHSATGALGLAAIEICKYIGCKIIATAGNEDKRNYLRKLGCIEFVTDSRNLEIYKKDILDYTNGKGVDVILSATIDEHLLANLDLLRPMGRLLDVSKKNIYEQKNVPLSNFIKSIQYNSIHFDKLLKSNNQFIRNIMNKVIELFNSNKLNLFKISCFPISQYKDVFLEFSKSKHIGKIVLNRYNHFVPTDTEISDNMFSKDKYYLITGGTGGIGLKLIDWLHDNGAQNILVTSRKSNVKLPQKNNLNIRLITTDLLDKESLSELLKPYNIDGVFHLAGLTDDKMVPEIKDEDVSKILDVKVKGIQNLGEIFEKRDHQYFVAFSSIVSLIGNPGQSLYSAANSYMDLYCYKRYKNNLPALSINLGAIGGCGMIQNNFNLAKTMKSNGIDFTVYHDLFSEMKKNLLNQNIYQICITDQDWSNLENMKTKVIFEKFINNINDNSTNINSFIESKEKLINYIKKLLGSEEELDLTKDLVSYGVDSIMSMDIANWCKNSLDLNIKQIDILQGISINEILAKLPNIDKEIIVENKDSIFLYECSIKPEDKVVKNNTNLIYIFTILLSLFLSLLYIFW